MTTAYSTGYVAMAETVYSRKQIDQWQSKLVELAEKPRTRFTKKQAVEALIEPIEKALAAHPYDQVAESLKEWGLDISPGSLKQYVNAYRRSHRPVTKTSASTRKRSSTQKKKQGATRQTKAAATLAAAPETEPLATTASSDKPKRFVEMPETL
ncbi:MAG: hypothetical protein ACR2FS_06535 [Phormidesmis sp.]